MKTSDEVIRETLDRAIRIETRLTSFLVKQGETTVAPKPVWDESRWAVVVPQLDCSLSSCMNAVPLGFADDDDDVDVITADGRILATLILKELK